MKKTGHPYKVAVQILPFFFRPFVKRMALLFFIGLAYAFFEALSIAIAYPLFSVILGREPSQLGGNVLEYISGFIYTVGEDNYFATVLLFFVVVIALKSLFQFFRDYYSFSLGQLIREKYSNLTFHKYILADTEFLLDQKQGKVLHNIMTAPGYMTVIFSRIPITVTEAFKLAAIFILLLSVSYKITLLMLFIGVLFQLSIYQISKKVTFFRATEVVSATEDSNVLVNESINGSQQLRIFQAEPRWISAFARENRAIRLASNKGIFYQHIPSRLAEVLAVSVTCGTLLFLRHWMPGRFEDTLPIVGIFLMAVARILPSLTALGNDWLQIIGRLPYAQGVYNALQSETNRIIDGTEKLSSLKRIQFENLNYSYPNRKNPAVHDVSFDIEPLKMTALVGGSGSGKSTIVNLLVRLISPSSGDIKINGTSLSEIRISSWLDKIGYVSQDTFIFNASISDNISFGLDCSEEEIINAAKLANAHEFITSLPQGYNTMVGDRGLKLSGGQRQRVAIARAVVRNPELLILDEATSSLDNIAEAAVQRAISMLSRRYTVLVVAHRLNTIRNASKIVVFKNGSLIESGTHDQLIAGNGEYAGLYLREKHTKGA